MRVRAKRFIFISLALASLAFAAQAADLGQVDAWLSDDNRDWSNQNFHSVVDKAHEIACAQKKLTGCSVEPPKTIGPLMSPLLNSVKPSSTFGYREPPIPGASRWHLAIDLPVGMRTPVFASFPGMIVASSENRDNLPFPEQIRFIESRFNPAWVAEQSKKAEKNGQYWSPARPGPFDHGCGNYVVEGILPMRNPTKNRWDWGGFILYCHLDEVTRMMWSEPIGIEDRIAYSGQTGIATGPHLHVAVFLEPVTLPKELQGLCARNQSNQFEDTCAVDPNHYLYPRWLLQ